MQKEKHNKVVIPMTTSIAGFFVLLITLVILWIIKRKRTKDKKIIQSRNQCFTFREIQSITGNFNTIIWKGGFGTVFHGCIGDTQVAVKMLYESSAQGCREIQAEVHFLISIHHRNITSLVGYCDEGSQKGIIYEYMEYGNLGLHLFDGRPNVMSWKKRLEIGYDAAQGLEYMHHGCTPAIVHRDVKCSNILLNEQFRAKLADFISSLSHIHLERKLNSYLRNVGLLSFILSFANNVDLCGPVTGHPCPGSPPFSPPPPFVQQPPIPAPEVRSATGAIAGGVAVGAALLFAAPAIAFAWW